MRVVQRARWPFRIAAGLLALPTAAMGGVLALSPFDVYWHERVFGLGAIALAAVFGSTAWRGSVPTRWLDWCDVPSGLILALLRRAGRIGKYPRDFPERAGRDRDREV